MVSDWLTRQSPSQQWGAVGAVWFSFLATASIESGQLTSLALEFKTRREGPVVLRQLYAHSLESRFISPVAAVSGVAPGPRPAWARCLGSD